MKTKKYAGTQFRWESGGKSLEIENKYRVRPFCKIIFESDKIIQEPERIVERLLGMLFPVAPTGSGEPTFKELTKAHGHIETLIIREGNNVCKVCGKVCKSKLGLISHSRKHKKENKDGNKKK